MITATRIEWDGHKEWYVCVEATNGGNTSAGPYYTKSDAEIALHSIVRNDFDDDGYDLSKTTYTALPDKDES